MNYNMLLMAEEAFGPVIGMMRVEDENEAVRLAKDSSFGLSSSV